MSAIPITAAFPSSVRYEAAPQDNTYAAWNYDAADETNTNAPPAAGILNLSKIKIPNTITISALVSQMFTAGTGVTTLSGVFAAVYGAIDGSGNSALLGSSGDLSTEWATLGNGTKQDTLTAAATGSLLVQGGLNAYVFAGQLIVRQSTTAAVLYARGQGQAQTPNAGLVDGSANFLAGSVPKSFAVTVAGSSLPATIAPRSAAQGVDYWHALVGS